MKDYKERLEKEFGHLTIMMNNGSNDINDWEDVKITDLFENFIEQIISERDKEWYKNLELCTTAISEDGKVRFVRINESDFTNKLQTLIK